MRKTISAAITVQAWDCFGARAMTTGSAFPAAINACDYEHCVVVRHAFQLKWIAVAWMTIGVVDAFASRIVADGVTLLAFEIDDLLRSISAGILVRRHSAELRRALTVSEKAERSTSHPFCGVSLEFQADAV
jgi:hypothetical protein